MMLIALFDSRIRHLQDLQVARHPSHQGKPYLLHVLRVLRFEAISQPYQDRFPSTSRKEKQKQDGLEPQCSSQYPLLFLLRLSYVMCYLLSCISVSLAFVHHRLHTRVLKSPLKMYIYTRSVDIDISSGYVNRKFPAVTSRTLVVLTLMGFFVFAMVSKKGKRFCS